GWAQVARNFDVPCSILFLFIFGLVTFRYITIPFLLYNGGEVLLFAVSPWSLYALQKVVDKPAAACLAISLLSAALLFLAKLTGLVAFTANIVAISLVDVVKRRRVTSSLLAIWAGSAIAALFFLIFWLAWGRVPATPVVPWWSASWPGFAFTWLAIWFPMVGATFSGISGLDFLSGLFLRPSGLIKIYVLGPLGLLLMGWVWFRLRSTRYRSMAVCLFSIIAIYAAAFVVMYVRGAAISFEERHLRYAGILFLLLMLVAINQWRESLAKAVTILIVGSFAVYGLTSYVNIAREFMRGRHYDPVSGVSMRIVSPVVLEYLRSEMAVQKWQDAIAVVPSPEAAIGLPRFRIIEVHVDFSSLEEIAAGKKWAGRVEKVFVMVRETMRGNGKAEALLRLFVDYDIEKWRQIQLDGMIVYSQ
ncbi:MAG TPA: hypothetical protein VFF31_05145, partial [Blastocatellia bacterium]|nr:hypothetical protein [Blastocatellia bacterium]